jgi:spore coat protein CotH
MPISDYSCCVHARRAGSCVLLAAAVCLAMPRQLPAVSPAPDESDSRTFYQLAQTQTIHLQIRAEDLARMEAALPERVFVPATFQWNELTIDNVGVRYKGNSSSIPGQRHKRGFLIKFNAFEKGRTFQGLYRIALDNGVQFGSLLSEPLITGILRDLDMAAPRCNYATLYINDIYKGVYVNVERIDEVFVRNHFADGDGALYKVDEGGPGADWSPVHQPPGASGLAKIAFEPQTDAARRDAADVLELIQQLNQAPAGEFAATLESRIELDAFLKTMAVMLFSGAFDQFTGWNPHNYCLYHEPRTNRWHYLPFDLDVGFADNAFGQVPVLAGWNAAWPVPGGPPRPVIERIVDDPALLARYRQAADKILEDHFRPEILLPRLDALYDSIKPDLADDPFPHRRVTNPEDRDYDSIAASMKDFIRRRYATARAQLDHPGARPEIVRSQPRPQPGPQPGPPSADAPSDLRVTSCSATAVSLQWTDNTREAAGYILQRALDEEGGQFHNYLGQPGDKVVSAVDERVTPGQSYRYRVYAIQPTPGGPRGTGVSNTVVVHVPPR